MIHNIFYIHTDFCVKIIPGTYLATTSELITLKVVLFCVLLIFLLKCMVILENNPASFCHPTRYCFAYCAQPH
jgi:hypothetical protein